ncbi:MULTISPECIES: hypothetical protein [Flavobacteriaceae]|uniref:hypothetical protein n=1 Tax=Flavobacteriaceae TaxID=49546 RepID=UPI003A8CAE64
MSKSTLTNSNVTVIIRATDERSIEACKQCVLTEIKESNLHIIKEVPFSKAVQKTFEIGIASNEKWTLAIDADLILLPNAITNMLKAAEKYNDNLYVFQGFILDKFKCGIRQGGPHLYKTENLKIALKLVDDIEMSLRPESDIYKKMSKQGYDIVLEKKIYALHDFFQYYKDIYRKAYFHGIKHKGWKTLLPKWLDKGSLDFDYRIASIGFLDGYYAEKQVYPSINEFDSKVKYLLFTQLNIEEKEILNLIDIEKIKETISSYNIDYNSDLDIIFPKKPLLIRIKNKLFP